MPKQLTLIDQVREDYEDALITNSLLAEMNATGGLLIPRAILFTQTSSGDWNLRVSALREPPSLASLDACRAEARAVLQEKAGEAPGVACLICPAAFQTDDKPSARAGMAVLDWCDAENNRHMTLLRTRRNGETFETREMTSEMWDLCTTSWAKNHPDARDATLTTAILDRLTPTLSKVIHAAIPEASSEDDISGYLQTHGPLFEAVKDHTTKAVNIAIQLAELRADTVLAHMVMTVNYLQEQSVEQAEKHQEELNRLRLNQERQQSKTTLKLQRELEMSRKRADVLARQVQEARSELRSAQANGTAASPASPGAFRDTRNLDYSTAPPLQRRLRNYLRKFPAFSRASATAAA